MRAAKVAVEAGADEADAVELTPAPMEMAAAEIMGLALHRSPRGCKTERARRPPLASKSMPDTASILRMPRDVAAVPELVELNIGHFLIGEALFVGLGESGRHMRVTMDEAKVPRGKATRKSRLSGGT